jgi:hypothetical protein
MSRFYKGYFTPQNPNKYKGDVSKIVYRSSWELSTFAWLDKNESVISWSSEEFSIPYLSPLDNKIHRYFPDLYITFDNKKTYLIEIKPKNQTKFKKNSITFFRNIAKWEAAYKFAEINKIEFNIWTEKELKMLGIKLL